MFYFPNQPKKRRRRTATVTRFPVYRLSILLILMSAVQSLALGFRSFLHEISICHLWYVTFSETYRREVDNSQPCIGVFSDRYHGGCNNWNPSQYSAAEKTSVNCASMVGKTAKSLDISAFLSMLPASLFMFLHPVATAIVSELLSSSFWRLVLSRRLDPRTAMGPLCLSFHVRLNSFLRQVTHALA